MSVSQSRSQHLKEGIPVGREAIQQQRERSRTLSAALKMAPLGILLLAMLGILASAIGFWPILGAVVVTVLIVGAVFLFADGFWQWRHPR